MRKYQERLPTGIGSFFVEKIMNIDKFQNRWFYWDDDDENDTDEAIDFKIFDEESDDGEIWK